MRVPILATASDNFGFAFAFKIDDNIFDGLVFCEGEDDFAYYSVAGSEEPRLELLSIRTLLNENSKTINHCSEIEVDIEWAGNFRKEASAWNGLKEMNLDKMEGKPCWN
jgi:hypothetical protein